ncbi:MAG TPA: nitroreductase/quinone reductase family protein [Streptosporangiaceae bacterium]
MTQAQPSSPGGGASGGVPPAPGTGRPRARRLQARFFRAANVPMRAVLGLPVPTPLGRRLMLARIVGRKTGRVYRQPLSYVRDGDALLTPGGGKWKLNLRGDQPVTLRLRGRDVTARPEVVRDPDEIGRLFALMAEQNPAVLRFAGIRDDEGRPDPAKLATAVRYGFTIVRWHLNP